MHEALVFSRVLRVSGDSTRSVERAVRAGSLVRVRPGVAIPAEVWAALDAAERHRVAMDALTATSRVRPVFAVESAAALHGIPLIGPWPRHPRVAASLGRSRRPRVATSARWDRFDDDELVDLEGHRATSPARTAIDLASERSLEGGVAAIDHVRHVHGVELSELQASVSARRPYPGVHKVDAALRLSTGRSESVLESLSLVRFQQLGFARPLQQVEFSVEGESYRVDFFWPEAGVVGEADGRSKYDDAPAAAVWDEKLREDDLRTVVAGFARWSWDEAWAGAPLAVKLERAGLTPDPRNASKYAFRMRD